MFGVFHVEHQLWENSMNALEEMGIRIRGYALDLQKMAHTLRTTDHESASQLDEIANNITKTLNGEDHETRNN